MESILNVTVSCFANYQATKPQNVNLLKFITSGKYREKVEQLRQETDQITRQTIKQNLPAITPSGVFSERNINALKQHSGFLQFDIDFKENQHIQNFTELKKQISNISCVAFCGLSVSGTGFWGLVPIQFPEKHKLHFKALQIAFLQFGIKLDSAPSNPASLRGYSFDPSPYINHQAEIFRRIFTPPTYTRRQFSQNVSDEERKVQTCIIEIERLSLDITGTYHEWLVIGYSLAGAFGESGRDYFHRASQFHPQYSIQKTDQQFTRCLEHGSGDVGAFLKRCDLHGIRYKNIADYEYKTTLKPETKLLDEGIQENKTLNSEQIIPQISEPELSNRVVADINNTIAEPRNEAVLASSATFPDRNCEPYYEHSFKDLVQELGEDEALKKVAYYQDLSRQYASCHTFVIHSCLLLRTFSQRSAA